MLLPGTGPDGRIVKKDIERFVPSKVTPVSSGSDLCNLLPFHLDAAYIFLQYCAVNWGRYLFSHTPVFSLGFVSLYFKVLLFSVLLCMIQSICTFLSQWIYK